MYDTYTSRPRWGRSGYVYVLEEPTNLPTNKASVPLAPVQCPDPVLATRPPVLPL